MSLQDKLQEAQKQLEAERTKLSEMKSEEKTVAEAVEDVQDQVNEVQHLVETRHDSEYSEIERQAIESGWDPNHKGPNFVSAKEFVERGSFFRKIDTQNKKIEDLTKVIKSLTDHYAQVEEVSYKKGVQDALQERQAAVITGDVKAFNDAEQKLKQLETNKPKTVAVPVSNEPSKAGLDFVARNKDWFNQNSAENIEITKLAIAYGDYLVQTYPNMSEEDVLKDTENTIKAMPRFKHRFENQQSERPSMVGTSTQKSSGRGKTLSSRMSESQRTMFEQARKIDPKLDLEKYAKQLDMIGRLQNDK